MSRLLLGVLLVCAPIVSACGSQRSAGRATVPPNAKLLCGTWQGGGISERWWIDGRDLRGEGRFFDEAGELVSTEQLLLEAHRRGHVYVAQPGDAAPTSFSPIDPRAARYGVQAPAAALVWVWANYDHDFPQEIHYVVLGDRLEATIAGGGDAGGDGIGWKLERVAACDATR